MLTDANPKSKGWLTQGFLHKKPVAIGLKSQEKGARRQKILKPGSELNLLKCHPETDFPDFFGHLASFSTYPVLFQLIKKILVVFVAVGSLDSSPFCR